jgi:nucleoside-diphosphate-sugar epimerase
METASAPRSRDRGPAPKSNFLHDDVPITFADVSKARKMLGYEPKVPIREGLRRYVAWYRGSHPRL